MADSKSSSREKAVAVSRQWDLNHRTKSPPRNRVSTEDDDETDEDGGYEEELDDIDMEDLEENSNYDDDSQSSNGILDLAMIIE